MNSLPNTEFQNLFSRRKILWKIFSHMVYYTVTNNFEIFVSFAISGGSCNPSQITLRLINEFEKCFLSSIESLIVDFIQFSSTITKFLFLQRRLGSRLCVLLLS